MMPDSNPSPGRKFRTALADAPLIVPGVFNALVAKMAQQAGFRAAYQSGAALSAGLAALPDIGLITQTEFARQGQYLAQAVDIPIISDADTGFGPALSVERTVHEFEAAGLAGLHLEDQQMPKRCGHLSGKTLVDRAEMVGKLKAALRARHDGDFVIIARTDARATEGLDAAIDRARAYVDAGADMIFPEALESADEFERFARAVKVPLVANMTEFGKSPLLSVRKLGEMGYAAVLFPVTLFRLAMHAVERGLAEIAQTGTQRHMRGVMLTRAQLYELLGYQDYEERDREYFGDDRQ